MRILLYLVASVLAGALLGWLIMRNGWTRAYGAILAGHLFAALGLFVGASQYDNMQGLGYAILLSVFVIPATLGFALGGGFAWWRRR